MIGQHHELFAEKAVSLTRFGNRLHNLSGLLFQEAFYILYHVTCTFSCPVSSSLELALPAIALALPAVLQQQQLVTSPHATYHPRASICFFSSRLQHFHCSASQLQRRQHTHSDSRAATFRDRKRTAVPTRPLTRTIVQNNTSVMLL